MVSVAAKASADEATLVVAAASVVSVSRAIVVGDVVYWLTFLARYLSQLRSSSSIKEWHSDSLSFEDR